MTLYRAHPAPAYEAKPSWHGQFQRYPNGPWETAGSLYGPISYASAEAAVAGARVASGVGAIVAGAGGLDASMAVSGALGQGS